MNFQTFALAGALARVERALHLPGLALYPVAETARSFEANNKFTHWLTPDQLRVALKVMFQRVREVPASETVDAPAVPSTDPVTNPPLHVIPERQPILTPEEKAHQEALDAEKPSPFKPEHVVASTAPGTTTFDQVGDEAGVFPLCDEIFDKPDVPVQPIGSVREEVMYGAFHVACKSVGLGRLLVAAPEQVNSLP